MHITIEALESYLADRYGGWAGAQAWWDAHHWY